MILSPRFKLAFKTALAMVIAYYISLSMGWSHSHWAGLAVALCMLDTVGDSVNKGALRIFGTFAAGSVALLLAALFPQDRWGYLLCATLYLALCTYMTGHSSRWYFWFIGGYVMALLALAGGPTGATLFETVVLRVQQTSMGFTVYTLVSVLLWPTWKAPALSQTVSSLAETQRQLIGHYFGRLAGAPDDVVAAKLCGQAAGILARLPSVVDGAEVESSEVWETRRLWRRCPAAFAALNEAAERWRFGFADLAKLDVARFLPRLPELGAEFEARLAAVGRMLAGEPPGHRCVQIPVELDQEAEASLPQFDRAALMQARDQVRRIDELTRELFDIFADIRGFGSEVQRGRTAPRPGPAWAIDPDRLAYAVRTFSAVWIILLACIYIPDFPMPPGIIPVAAAISIQLALMPDMPVQKLIAPMLGSVAFAGVFHIFVMPHLHDFVGLGTGIFVAIFLICFVLSKPEQAMARGIGTSFFVMVISVNNQQSYDFLYVVNFGLMTQLAMGALWITSWFPISFRPQDAIFKQMRRFFTGCERIASAVHGDARRHRLRMPLAFHLNEVRSLPGRIGRWMAALPTAALGRGTREEAQALVNSLQELGDGMRALIESREARQSDTIRRALTADVHAWRVAIQEILRHLAVSPVSEEATVLRSRLDAKLAAVEDRIESAINAAPLGRSYSEEIEKMYRLLGAYRRVSEALVGFASKTAGIDWTCLREARF
jgi:uncharacterized membrane protein YccC